MNKYILSSPSFVGEIHVTYSIDNQLIAIDFMRAELTTIQTDYFTRKVPVTYTDNWLESFGKTKLKAVHQNYEVEFDEFWEKYGRKINRERCIKIWDRLSKADRVKAYLGADKYANHLIRNSWKSKADPETYLKNHYWHNEWK